MFDNRSFYLAKQYVKGVESFYISPCFSPSLARELPLFHSLGKSPLSSETSKVISQMEAINLYYSEKTFLFLFSSSYKNLILLFLSRGRTRNYITSPVFYYHPHPCIYLFDFYFCTLLPEPIRTVRNVAIS